MIKKIELKETEYGPVLMVEKEFQLSNPYNIHRCNEYLRSLGTRNEVRFESFEQYQNLLKLIAKELNIPYELKFE